MTLHKSWYFTPSTRLSTPSDYDEAAKYTGVAHKMGLNLQVYPAWDWPEQFIAQYHSEADLALFRLQVGV